MRKTIYKNYKRYSRIKNKKSVLKRFFDAFLPEVVYRTTKIEHPKTTRKTILSAFK